MNIEGEVNTFKEPFKKTYGPSNYFPCVHSKSVLYCTHKYDLWFHPRSPKQISLRCLSQESGITSHIHRATWGGCFHSCLNGILPLLSNGQRSVLSATYLHTSPVCFLKSYLFIIVIITPVCFTKSCGLLSS